MKTIKYLLLISLLVMTCTQVSEKVESEISSNSKYVEQGDNVLKGSVYKDDMRIFDQTIGEKYSNISVACYDMPTGVFIMVMINRPWIEDYTQLGYFVGVAGAFTENTAWHSDDLIMVYNRISIVISTNAARNFTRNSNIWPDWKLIQWFDYNVKFIKTPS